MVQGQKDIPYPFRHVALHTAIKTHQLFLLFYTPEKMKVPSFESLFTTMPFPAMDPFIFPSDWFMACRKFIQSAVFGSDIINIYIYIYISPSLQCSLFNSCYFPPSKGAFEYNQHTPRF